MDRDCSKFERIHSNYRVQILEYLYKLVGVHAEDAAQDTFIKLYDRIEEINETEAKQWLYTVAHNKGIDLMRREKRVRSLQEKMEYSHIPGHDAEKEISERELIHSVFEKMKPKQVQLLCLHTSGLTYREIACVMEIKMSSVSKLLVRSKESFQKIYQTSSN